MIVELVYVILYVFFQLNTIIGVRSLLSVKFYGYLSKHYIAISRVERGMDLGPEKIMVFLGPYPLLFITNIWSVLYLLTFWGVQK